MKKEKQYLFDDIKGQVKDSQAFVLFKYQGLKANDVSKFRGELDKMGAHIEMVPKRVFKKAATELSIELTDAMMEGHLGLVLMSKDSMDVTKEVFKFGQKDNVLTILAGKLDGIFYGGKEVEVLSKLPSRDEMRASFLGLLEAPMANTLATIEAKLEKASETSENG